MPAAKVTFAASARLEKVPGRTREKEGTRRQAMTQRASTLPLLVSHSARQGASLPMPTGVAADRTAGRQHGSALRAVQQPQQQVTTASNTKKSNGTTSNSTSSSAEMPQATMAQRIAETRSAIRRWMREDDTVGLAQRARNVAFTPLPSRPLSEPAATTTTAVGTTTMMERRDWATSGPLPSMTRYAPLTRHLLDAAENNNTNNTNTTAAAVVVSREGATAGDAPPLHVLPQPLPGPAGSLLLPAPGAFMQSCLRHVAEERACATQTMHLALRLFHGVIQAHPKQRRLVLDPQTQMELLALRAAVSCALLDELVTSLPRHQAVLAPYIHLLLQYVFVPDSAAMREALGGTVRCAAILQGVRRLLQEERQDGRVAQVHSAHAAHRLSPVFVDEPHDFARYSGSGGGAAAAGHGAVDEVLLMLSEDEEEEEESEGEGEAAQRQGNMCRSGTSAPRTAGVSESVGLLRRYSNKPFFLAHLQLTKRVVTMGHTVRSREIHFQRLPRMFEMTYMNWNKTLLRTVLRLWAKLCQSRRVQEQKYRTRWAKRWSTERQRVSIRQWRGYAAYTLQIAEADNAARALLYEKKETLRGLRAELDRMHQTSRELTSSIHDKEAVRAEMERKMDDLEEAYKNTLEQVRQVDRIGSCLIDSLLLRDALPTDTAPELRHDPQQHLAGAALQMLVAWADQVVLLDGQETEELCAMTPQQQKEQLQQQRGNEKTDRSNNNNNNPLEDGASSHNASSAATSRRGSSVSATGYLSTPQQHQARKKKKGRRGEGRDSNKNKNNNGSNSSSSSSSLTSSSTTDAKAMGEKERPVFVELLLSSLAQTQSLVGSNAGSSSAAAPSSSGVMVLIPLYKFLVLMRCIGHTEEDIPSIEVVRMVKTADAAVLAELAELQHNYHDAQPHPDENSEDDEVSSATSHTTAQAFLLQRLTPEMHTTAEDVARILVDSYEHLTHTAAVVTAEQLVQRERGVLLVFLASLLRYYTNWVVRKTERVMAESVPMDDADPSRPTSASVLTQDRAISSAQRKQRQKSVEGMRAYQGKRHPRYPEWFTPPSNHVYWLERIDNQRGWVALSFSALHRAVCEARRPRPVLSVAEQDLVNYFMHFLSLGKLSEVLPRESERMAEYYMHFMHIIEHYFQRLLLVFRTYAVSWAELRAARGDDPAANGDDRDSGEESENENGSDDEGRRRGGRTRRSVMSLSPTSQTSPTSSSVNPQAATAWQDDLYLPASCFWQMLCDAQLAGDPPAPHKSTAYAARSASSEGGLASIESPTTAAGMAAASLTQDVALPSSRALLLHRPAVMSIVEHVVLRTLTVKRTGHQARKPPLGATSAAGRPGYDRAGRRSSAATALLASARRRSQLQRNALSSHPRPASPPRPAGGEARHLSRSKQGPYYARAVQESRYVDLRSDRGGLCMNVVQFVEALIRCAHCLQCIQQQQQVNARAAAAAAEQQQQQQQQEAANTASPTPSSPPSRQQQQQQQQHAAATARLSVTAANADSRASLSLPSFPSRAAKRGGSHKNSLSISALNGAENAAGNAARQVAQARSGSTAEAIRLYYEYTDYSEPLHPVTLERMLVDGLLSYNMCAQMLLPPFQRARRRPRVRLLLATHHDAFFALFSHFMKPHETIGIRGALPPPYSSYYTRPPSARRGDATSRASVTPPVPRTRLGNASGRASPSPRADLTRSPSPQTRHTPSPSSTQTPTPSARGLATTATNNTTAGGGNTAAGGGRRAAGPSRDVGIVAAMSYGEFAVMAKELGWLTQPRLTERTLQHCFNAVRVDTQREKGVLFFPEFLDVLCALAYFFHTDPMLPLEDKLEPFLHAHVLNHASEM